MRTTIPTPTVYRSLPVTSATSIARSTPDRVKVEESGPKSGSNSIKPEILFPLPPVPISSLGNLNGAIWKDEMDLKAFEEKLKQVCTSSELTRTNSCCEFNCVSESEDGSERCEFIVNIWRVPEGEEGAHGKFLIQLDRCQGCPFFYRQTIAKFVSGKTNPVPTKLFRVPALPSCLCDEGAGIKQECVENVVSLATSELLEQRVQGLKAISDLCSNSAFVSIFKSSNGPERLQKLNQDKNCYVQKFVTRILTACN